MHHAHLDKFAGGDSPVHRLDARVKLLVVLAYSAVLVSFDRYALAVLAPMAVLPLGMLWAGLVPLWFAVRRVLVSLPFVAMLCLASPLYDRTEQAVALGPWAWAVRGGWLTAGDILVKFTLGLFALTALMSTTPFAALLQALRRFRVPRLLVMQLGFLYRYIFVLLDQAMRIRRGRDFRGAGLAPFRRRLAAAGGVIGSLFVRTLDRSDRIYLAMTVRGYHGEHRGLIHLHLHRVDVLFALAAGVYLVACRFLYPWLLKG